MYPLSCANCCHNPLQTGPVGYPVGYCTRLGLTLLAPALTTCGQLQRRDLQRERAESERANHAHSFSTQFVSDLATRSKSTLIQTRAHPAEERDPVVSEVRGYGLIPKIGTLAALRSMENVRAEIALTSLGRAYFANCMRRDGRWTSGLHLTWWMVNRLADEPRLDLQDLREPSEQSLDERVDLGVWYVVTARLLLLLDVSNASRRQPRANGVPSLAPLVTEAFLKVPAGSGARLLRFLKARRTKFAAALPEKHYQSLARDLHQEPSFDEDPASSLDEDSA